MAKSRKALSSVYGFIVIFTILMAGIAAVLTIMDSQASVWAAQDRARQVQSSQGAERLALSLNGTSLTVRNVGLVPSHLLYLYQKGSATSASNRIDDPLQEGSNLTLAVSGGMSSFAVITSRGNEFWVYNSTQLQPQSSTVPVTFDASGLDPSFGSATIVSVDGAPYTYSSMPKTFEWTTGSSHSYSFAQGFAAGTGTRVGWSYARGLSSAMAGTVAARQPGSVVSTYGQQYLLTATGGNAVQYIGSPSNDGWYNAGSSAQVSTDYAWNLSAGQSRQSLVSYSLDGGTPASVGRAGVGSFAFSVTMNAPHTLTFNSVTQYYLLVSGGNGVGVSAPSPTEDGFHDTGAQLTVSSNWVWNTVSGQSRTALSNWQLDGTDQSPPRASSGVLTTGTLTMDTYHAVNFLAVVQYYLASSGGGGYTYSVASQTADGWFDSGTVSQVQSASAFNVVTGQTRSNLLSFTLDGVQTTLTRSGSGSAGPTITFNTYHTLSFSSVSQYALNAVGGSGITYSGSVTNDGWYDSGSTATVTTNYSWGLAVGQSRSNLVSWNLDGGASQAATRAGSGTYTTAQITMNTFHTVNFNSALQYFVTAQGNVPSSGGTGALTVGYSYSNSASSVSNSANGVPSLSVSMPGSGTLSSLSGSMTASETPNSYGTNQHSYDSLLLTVTYGSCSKSQSFVLSSSPQTFTVSYSCSTSVSGGSATLSTTQQISCTQGDNDVNCGTVSYGQSTVSATSATTVSASTSSSPNTYSVSGNTVTYSYGVGYNFPSGSASTSWSASWPSTESYSSNNCAGGSVSGHTITGTGGPCTLTATCSGSYSATLVASPTGDGYYDAGSSVSISASGAGPFSFSSWSGPAGIAVTSPGSASTAITINTYGTIVANFNVNQ